MQGELTISRAFMSALVNRFREIFLTGYVEFLTKLILLKKIFIILQCFSCQIKNMVIKVFYTSR